MHRLLSCPWERGGARPPHLPCLPDSGVRLPGLEAYLPQIDKVTGAGLTDRKPGRLGLCGWASSHLWLEADRRFSSLSLQFRPIPVSRNFVPWDCKNTPANSACQEGNTICCIPSNDGLGAWLWPRFPHRGKQGSWSSLGFPFWIALDVGRLPIETRGKGYSFSKHVPAALKPPRTILWLAGSHQVEARWRRAAIAAGLRQLTPNANDLLEPRLPRLGGPGLGRSSDLLDVESLDGKVDEDRIIHCACDELVFVCHLLRHLHFALLTFGKRWHGNVDVFEDTPRSDAENALGRLDQIVAFPAAVLATEVIDEGESGVELFCLNQKASAVRLPFRHFHWRAPKRKSSCLKF